MAGFKRWLQAGGMMNDRELCILILGNEALQSGHARDVRQWPQTGRERLRLGERGREDTDGIRIRFGLLHQIAQVTTASALGGDKSSGLKSN